MGHLPFPPDAELTGPDRVVLSVLQKQYELSDGSQGARVAESAEDSDDSALKHSEFVAPSPEGKHIQKPRRRLFACHGNIFNISLTIVRSTRPRTTSHWISQESQQPKI